LGQILERLIFCLKGKRMSQQDYRYLVFAGSSETQAV